MKKDVTPTAAVASGVAEAWRDVGTSFERFCLTAGIATLVDMMERDAADLCGPRYGREDGRCGHRWGQAAGKLGFHGGKMPIERPRVRARNGRELALPSWEAAQAEDWLGRWAEAAKVPSACRWKAAGGHEPDADQRLDTPVRARRLVAGR
jgi:putative transposase